jgi:hypothetical protein
MPVLPVAGELSNERGLRIVDAIAARWAVQPIPDDGKVVWFEVVE